MPNLFRAFKVAGGPPHCYLVESTAPDNVEDLDSGAMAPYAPLAPIDPDDALDEIADLLVAAVDPQIAITVHGFNNPPKVVLERYAAAFEDVTNDPGIAGQNGLVCIGYRWPSEPMFHPGRSTVRAAPALLLLLACLGLALLGLAWRVPFPPAAIWLNTRRVLFVAAGALLSVPFTTFLLRLVVYFRDSYRAANYGVPDLVEILRQLDARIEQQEASRAQQAGEQPRSNRIGLSIVGHSMGGFVVTNAVRILSDVFSPPSVGAGAGGPVAPSAVSAPRFNPAGEPVRATLPIAEFVRRSAAKQEGDQPQSTGPLQSGVIGKSPTADIGHSYRLLRLVLVSPDIPAEALLAVRANFLAACLLRFPESYLFCNEEDEVLRQVSTVANYFSFPTQSRDNGYRLGTTGVMANSYGITNLVQLRSGSAVDDREFLKDLRVGRFTLLQRYERADPRQAQLALPQVFTYVDCTDYVEHGRGVLTYARPGMMPRRNAGIPWWTHARLLITYPFAPHHGRDVHSGYFSGAYSRRLIYRLACLGIDEALAAYQRDALAAGTAAPDGLATLSGECAQRQIKVLLSPRMYAP